jgi:hypothetical protein
MSNDPKNPGPRVEDLPVLQIVEIEEVPSVDRLEELGDILNRISPPEADQPPARCWN